jgi:methionine-rich copper-binding protein CopC
MPDSRNLKSLLALFVIAGSLMGCTSTGAYSPFLGAEPAVGSILSSAPRNLRLFYDALPDVPNSSISLVGPSGSYELRGFHTMGANDLMIEITNPSIPDGDYEVKWAAAVGDDPTVYEGTYTFSVATNR